MRNENNDYLTRRKLPSLVAEEVEGDPAFVGRSFFSFAATGNAGSAVKIDE